VAHLHPHATLAPVPHAARLRGCPCALAPHHFAHLIHPTRPRIRETHTTTFVRAPQQKSKPFGQNFQLFLLPSLQPLAPHIPGFSADLCARTMPHGGVYGGPHKCVSPITTATSSNSSKPPKATYKLSRTTATCATTKSSGGRANPTSQKPWPKHSAAPQSTPRRNPPRPRRNSCPNPRHTNPLHNNSQQANPRQFHPAPISPAQATKPVRTNPQMQLPPASCHRPLTLHPPAPCATTTWPASTAHTPPSLRTQALRTQALHTPALRHSVTS
jgi:hypothetical protein